MSRGRPTKLTPETRTKICDAIRGGNYRYVAAEWAGVSRKVMGEWMRRGKKEPGIHREFRCAVLEAERAAEIRAVEIIMQAASSDPKHAEWWLERKFPERWGRRDRLDARVVGNVRHEVHLYIPDNGREVPYSATELRANGNGKH